MKKEIGEREMTMYENLVKQLGCKNPIKQITRNDDASVVCLTANKTVIVVEDKAYVISPPGSKVSVFKIESLINATVVRVYQEGTGEVSPQVSSNAPTRLYTVKRARMAVAAG